MVHASKLPTVGIGMGDIGVPTRILGGRCGAPFTFATFNDDRVLAPGQIGWRQMREMYRYDSITAATRIYGVVADPVAHSLSPVVHNAALAAAGIDAVYMPFRVPAEQLDEFLSAASRWPLAGLSVTIPHKEAVLKHAAHTDDLVKSIGAANTLSFAADGITAANTDAIAAVESLVAALQGDERAKNDGLGLKTTLVLGAGGAARAVAFGLKKKGVEVTVAVAAGPWRARHTFLFLGARLAPQDCELLRQAAPEACPAAQAAGEGAAGAEPGWGSPAAQLAPLPLPLSASLGRTWAALSHDFNPIHMSAWAAHCFGLRGGMVAHGMAVVLLALRRAQQEQQLSGAAAAPLAGELRARFLRPLFLPDAHCTLALTRASAKPASPPQAGMLHTSLSIVSRGKECFVAELRY
jgi:acyl dehydratase